MLLCQHCTRVHFHRALESQAKRCFHISHHIVLHRSAHCALTPHWQRSRLLLISLILDSQLVRIAQQQKTLACSRQWQEEKRSTCEQVSHFPFVCLWRHGILCNVLNNVHPRDVAQNHAETCTGAYIYHGDAARFHEWEFRTRFYIACKTGVQHIEAMSKVCDRLRGDAFVAAPRSLLR